MRRVRVGSGVRWSGPVIAGAAVLVIGGLALLYQGGRVVTTLFAPGRDTGASGRYTKLLADSEMDTESSRKRFEGRSFFFAPSPWPRPVVPVVKNPDDDKPKPPPPPPPPPDKYTGPPVIACIGETVFFSDGGSIAVGEERSGVKVLATNPPWNVTLNHLTKDYSVDLLADGSSGMFTSEIGSSPFGAAVPPGFEVVDAKGASSGSGSGSGSDWAPPVATPSLQRPSGTTPPAAGAPPAPTPSRSGESTPSGGELPAPLTKEQIDGMDRKAAGVALSAVARARMSKSIDDATRKRLDQEYEWLQARIKAAAKSP